MLMFGEYILAAMERATYEIIDDPKPYYGEVPELQGVWSTGKTLEECRKELQSFKAETGSSYTRNRRLCY
jgi:predicted RNase H-like HicB family nuclease